MNLADDLLKQKESLSSFKREVKERSKTILSELQTEFPLN